MPNQLQPTLGQEQQRWVAGHAHVAGIDEAGRGALAGPVVAAALITPPGAQLAGVWAQVRDSKLLSPTRRAALTPRIQAAALTWAVGVAPAQVIDAVGIAAATRQAMCAAINALTPQPDWLLIDWVKLPEVAIPQTSYVRADQTIVSVAAASILAKTHRDDLMRALHAQYPHYGFAGHKGYAAASHREALARFGPCPEHRHTFAPIAQPRLLTE